MENSSNSVLLLFGIGSAVMIFMASAIVLFVLFYQKRVLREQLNQRAMELAHQHNMLQAQIESQEEERRRVAKDLHDDVGLMLQALRTTTLAVLQEASEADRKEVQQLVSEVDETVRRICWDLMPSSLEYFGLAEATEELCHRLSSKGNVPVVFSSSGKGLPLHKKKQTLLYRMIQELVCNSLKHARATLVEVKFTWTINSLQINVIDNGIGFSKKSEKNQAPRGHGLLSLENRSSLLPANLLFENYFPQGTNASITYLTIPHAEN